MEAPSFTLKLARARHARNMNRGRRESSGFIIVITGEYIEKSRLVSGAKVTGSGASQKQTMALEVFVLSRNGAQLSKRDLPAPQWLKVAECK